MENRCQRDAVMQMQGNAAPSEMRHADKSNGKEFSGFHGYCLAVSLQFPCDRMHLRE